jgi:putative NADPH-quinone reductase
MTAPILILDAHPEPDSLCTSLASAYARGANTHTSTRHIRLAELDFDLVLRRHEHTEQTWEPDLRDAADAILAARHIVLVYPTWWAGPPALLKGFIERVFLPGWAYKFEGGSPLPKPLLAGRTARLITTMDSPSWWYRLVHSSAGHALLTRPTLHFVGIKPVRHSTLYDVRNLSPQAIAHQIAAMEQTGARDALALSHTQTLLRRLTWAS